MIQALNSPNLNHVAEGGGGLSGRNFTFERVVERWKEVLEEILYGVERLIPPA